MDDPSAANPPAAKRSKVNSGSRQVFDESASVLVGGGVGDDSSPEPESQHQIEPALQVCRYLLEMFSIPLLRSHATVSLVNRDRLQLYHANRSVILVSSAIDFSGGDGLDKFIATIIAFHCLSLEKNGILDTMVPKNSKLLSQINFPQNRLQVQRDRVLYFAGDGEDGEDGEDKSFTVDLGDAISCDLAMVGRSTVVLNATSKRWEGVPLTGGKGALIQGIH